jgi:hypothetical protein
MKASTKKAIRWWRSRRWCYGKGLALQALDNLSGDRTEYQRRDRLSFMRFVGLGLEDALAGAKTL